MRLLTLPVLVLIAACSSVSPPDTPPEYTDPPEVATEGLIPAFVTAELPFDVVGSRDYAERVSIIEFFEQSGSIAPPVGGEILRGEWGKAGAVRRLELADGHYVIERIISNEPELFKYQIWVFTNSVGRGVEQIVGEQRYIPIASDKTRFEWTYAVKPKNGFTAIFVRRQMPDIEAFLQGAVDGWAANASEEATELAE